MMAHSSQRTHRHLNPQTHHNPPTQIHNLKPKEQPASRLLHLTATHSTPLSNKNTRPSTPRPVSLKLNCIIGAASIPEPFNGTCRRSPTGDINI